MKKTKSWTDEESVFDAGAEVPVIGGFYPPRVSTYGATYWFMRILAATVAAIWVFPPVAELVNRFVLRLW